MKRYSEIITAELTLDDNDENEDHETSSQELTATTNQFQQRPASLSEFLRLHAIPHTILSNGSSPGVASDPRSLVNHHIMMSRNASNRGVLRQRERDDSDLTANEDDDSSSSSNQGTPTLSYRVMGNPSIRFISTGGNVENNRPRMIQFRSSSQGDAENAPGRNSVRVISYPRSVGRDTRNDSPAPVTYILRHVPNSNGTGYVPIAVQHRNIAVSDDDSDDGL